MTIDENEPPLGVVYAVPLSGMKSAPGRWGIVQVVATGYDPTWARVECRTPRFLGAGRDGSAYRGGDREADRVLHLSTADPILVGDPVDQVVGGAGAVGSDQQITPVSRGDLRDRLACRQ